MQGAEREQHSHDDEQLERIPSIAAAAGDKTREFRIFGPPGTGKTTNVSRQITRAVNRFGSDSVLVTSFSRAAAAELASRDLPLSPDRVGTLHAHCWRSLGSPEIAEAHVDEWNRDNRHLQITASRRAAKFDVDDGTRETEDPARDGDRLLQELNCARAMLLPPEAWSAELRTFSGRWTSFKNSNGLLDFCDLIAKAYRDIRIAPGNPQVLFADEAQDLNPMQLGLIRSWGRSSEYFILALDDDQTIFGWTGARPEAVLAPAIPEDQKIILKQSYRVPRAVHALADKLIRTVTCRQEKIYLPRAADGALLTLTSGGWKSPEYGILKAASQHLDRGQTVMFLTSCAYMLHPIIAVLRKNGIPFHNPYRKSSGFWNPLRQGGRGSSSVNRILALLTAHPDFGEGHRAWNHRDLGLWTECLYAKGLLKAGARAKMATSNGLAAVSLTRLDELLEPAALELLLHTFEGDYRQLISWWRQRLTATFHPRLQFPVEVALARGPQGITETPKVTVGTIHSVKGGEADVVFLFPDLSQAGDAAYQHFGSTRDAVIRLFYVGLTRARDTVYVCQPVSGLAVRI